MALIKDGRIVADGWRYLPEADSDTGKSPELSLPVDLVVTTDQWQAHRDELLQRNGRLGILLKSDQPPSSIAEDLDHARALHHAENSGTTRWNPSNG